MFFNVNTVHRAGSPHGWFDSYHFGDQPAFGSSISHQTSFRKGAKMPDVNLVVLFVIDGMQPDGMQQADTPHIDNTSR